MKEAVTTLLMLLVLAPLAWGEDGPRTGYFKKSITPLELLGEEGARAISSVFEPSARTSSLVLRIPFSTRYFRTARVL